MSLNDKSNIAFFYNDLWKTKNVTASSEHYNFAAENSQKKWLTKSWQSAHGTGSSGGTFVITTSNWRIDFEEAAGGGPVFIAVPTGTYTAQSLATKIGIQMTSASPAPQTYTCTYNVDTLKFTISAPGNFELFLSQITNPIWNTIGYGNVDTGITNNSYTADNIRIHTEEWIKIGDGSPISVHGLFIFNHNVQTTGILQWQFSNNNFSTIAETISPGRYNKMAVELQDALITYSYIRIYIQDVDNPDGFVKIGRAWVSEKFLPDYGFAPGLKEPQKDLSKIKMSEGGESSSIILPQVKNMDFDFSFGKPWKDFTSTIRTFHDMFDSLGNALPLVVVTRELTPDSNTFFNPERYTLYCRIGNWKVNQVGGEIRSISMSLVEEK